jgi:hypothetical protein
MKKILNIPAYIWAFACLIVLIITFMNNDALAKQMSRLPFMKIHPKYQGGELNRSYEENGLKIAVNKSVHSSLFKSSHKGYVQVTFSNDSTLPRQISETIDYDFNGEPDFTVSVSTADGKTHFNALTPVVKSLVASSRVKKSWMIRVALDL